MTWLQLMALAENIPLNIKK